MRDRCRRNWIPPRALSNDFILVVRHNRSTDGAAIRHRDGDPSCKNGCAVASTRASMRPSARIRSRLSRTRTSLRSPFSKAAAKIALKLAANSSDVGSAVSIVTVVVLSSACEEIGASDAASVEAGSPGERLDFCFRRDQRHTVMGCAN